MFPQHNLFSVIIALEKMLKFGEHGKNSTTLDGNENVKPGNICCY